MKKDILLKFIILISLLITSSVFVWGQTEIHFDISKGDVRFTDTECTGWDISSNTIKTYTHNKSNHYYISGTTEQYNVKVGAADMMVVKDYIIYLDNAVIKIHNKRADKDSCAFAVWNDGSSTVAVILKDNSSNILYSGRNRAGLEKSGGKDAEGTLLITCEEGYKAWIKNHTHGHTYENNHNQSACTDNCGHLDARSGNSWTGEGDEKYRAGAGIGTGGQGSGGVNKANHKSGSNALVNLTIAGGNIQARGAWGSSASSTSGGGAAIGTGSAKTRSSTAGTVYNLNITGGNITAYRVDNSAACIGGGYRSGYVNMNIYGGTIKANLTDALNLKTKLKFTKMRAAAIGGGGGGTSSASPAGATVTIYNGEISALGQYGAAIGAGAGGTDGYGQLGTVIIYNGLITADTKKGDGNGAGAAIGSGGSLENGHAGNATVTINGGIINANSELGADIGGGGTNSTETGGYGGDGIITITGGKIFANTGGIGGGRANAGLGGNATITITKSNDSDAPDITAESIGGGRSNTQSGGNVTLNVSAGKLTVSDFIGGGIGGENNDMIGWAKVYIEGGTISGRTVMKASTTDGCVFEMSGGTLTSPITDDAGGAVYMIDPNGIATLSGGTIQNCKGTTGGAVYMTGGTFTISGGNMTNNTATQNGAAVYLAGTGKVIVNGGTITGTEGQNFSAIYMSGGEFTMSGGTIKNFRGTNSGAVFMEGGTFTMTGGTISNCNGTSSDEVKGSGAIYMSGGTFKISEEGTIKNCTGAANGGAVYLGGNGVVEVSGGNITGNKVTENGGAVYMAGGTFTMSNGSISLCEGDKGGAVYMAGGTFSISGNATMQSNNATNGGAVFLDGKGGKLEIYGGTIKGNQVTDDGGAIYLNDGTFNMVAGKVESNTSKGGNGAGIYINNGTVTLKGGEVTGNNAEMGKGGGFYVGGGNVTLSNGTISSNKASKAGGGICLEGTTSTVSMTVSGCTLTGNEATDGNGGGIFLSNAEMTYNGGLLTLNKATGTTTEKTGYKKEATSDATVIKGVGGGIYISTNSTLTFGDFSQLGVYANTADMAADDLFANGDKTSLLLPNITEMKLQNYSGNASGLGWYEDYIIGDESYANKEIPIAKGNTSLTVFEYRFRKAQELGSDKMRLYNFGEGSSIELKNYYISLALGFLFSDLTIRVTGLKPGESCIFSVEGSPATKYRYQVPVHGTTAQVVEQKIVKLPVQNYTVTLLQDWPWAYETPTPATITRKNSENEGKYEFSITHKTTPITHDEKRVSIEL